jgi:hypothetical protein
MFHTAYNSFESKPQGRDYIGKHSTEDLADGYLGSFKDESFEPDAKIILGYSKTAEGAVWLEIQYQRAFGVVENPQFANLSYQTSTKFSYSEGCPGEQNGMYGRTGEKNPNFGNVYSEESREKIRKSRAGKTTWHDPDTNEIRHFLEPPGEGNWVKGLPPNVKVSMRENKKVTNKGRKTYHNPDTGETRMSVNHPGEPWLEGQHPETVRKKAEGHRGQKRSAESVQRMKEAQQERYKGKTSQTDNS